MMFSFLNPCYELMIFSSRLLQRHEERVIIISSKNDDSLISDAESALYHIARAILKVTTKTLGYLVLQIAFFLGGESRSLNN